MIESPIADSSPDGSWGYRSPERRDRRHRGGFEFAMAERVMQYVEAHYAEQISLRDVARALAYSPAHLTDSFRRLTGTAVTAWIIRRRVEAARLMLHQESVTVATACERAGFNDLCYFTRQFVRIIGTTPGRYRAEVRRRIADGREHLITDGAIARTGVR